MLYSKVKMRTMTNRGANISIHMSKIQSGTQDKLRLIPKIVSGVSGRNGPTSIRVSWTSLGSFGLYTYTIWRSVDGSPYTIVTTTQSTIYTDNDVSGGSTYCYRVHAENQWGVGQLAFADCTLKS